MIKHSCLTLDESVCYDDKEDFIVQDEINRLREEAQVKRFVEQLDAMIEALTCLE